MLRFTSSKFLSNSSSCTIGRLSVLCCSSATSPLVQSKVGGNFVSSRKYSTIINNNNNQTSSIFDKKKSNELRMGLMMMTGSRYAHTSSSQPNTEALTAITTETTETVGEVAENATSTETVGDVINSVVSSTGPELSYTPVGMMIQTLMYLHEQAGLPWWGSIAVSTICIRCCMAPVMVYQMRNMGRMVLAKPEVEALTNRYKSVQHDPVQSAAIGKQIQDVFKRHNCSPVRSFAMIFVNAPVFLTFFLSLRRMSEEIPAMKEGGMLWFTDLSVADPYYILPLMTGATFFLTIELGAETGMPANQQAKFGRWLLRGLAVAMIPITASFPAALLMYWFTNNVFSLVQSVIFRRPTVRKLLDLPDLKSLAAAAGKSNAATASSQSDWQQLLGLKDKTKKTAMPFIPDTTFSVPPQMMAAKKKKLASSPTEKK